MKRPYPVHLSRRDVRPPSDVRSPVLVTWSLSRVRLTLFFFSQDVRHRSNSVVTNNNETPSKEGVSLLLRNAKGCYLTV